MGLQAAVNNLIARATKLPKQSGPTYVHIFFSAKEIQSKFPKSYILKHEAKLSRK
jgi:hypothetical protein